MAFGDFFGNMGNVAIGMQEGELVRGRIRAQNQQAERDASAIRQQQEQEAFGRMARRNQDILAGQMQLNPGQLPQAQQVETAAAPAWAAQPSPVTSGTPGVPRRQVTGTSDAYLRYKALHDASQGRLDQMRSPQGMPAQYQNQAAATKYQDDIRALQEETQGWKAGMDASIEAESQMPVPKTLVPSIDKSAAKQATDNAYAARVKELFKDKPSPYVTPELINALRATEGSGANAVSSRGARGAMQITAAAFADVQKAMPNRRLDFNDENDRVDAAIVYAHMLGQQLQAKGIPPTPQNIASAYHQGVGGVLKNGVASPNVSDGITTNAQYVDRFNRKLGTAQQGDNVATAQNSVAAPAQAGSDVRTAQNSAAVQAQMFTGPDIDQSMQILQSKDRMLQMQFQATFDHAARAQILAQREMLKYEAQDIQLQTLQHQAITNDAALNQMIGLYTRGSGQALGAQRLADGRIQLVNGQGQPVLQPMTRAELATAMYTGLSSMQRAKAAEQANVYRTALAKSSGEAEGKLPSDLRTEQQKGINAANVAKIHGNAQELTTFIQEQAKAGRFGTPIALPSGEGTITVNPGGGAIIHRGPVKDSRGIMSTPEPEYIPPPMVTGGAINSAG